MKQRGRAFRIFLMGLCVLVMSFLPFLKASAALLMPSKPTLYRYIQDDASLLSQPVKKELTAASEAMHKDASNSHYQFIPIYIVTISELGDTKPYLYVRELKRKWELKEHAVFILMTKKDKKAWIEPESSSLARYASDLNDPAIWSNKIVNEKMLPLIEKGKYDEAAINGFEGAARYILDMKKRSLSDVKFPKSFDQMRKEAENPVPDKESQKESLTASDIAIVVAAIAVVGGVIFGISKLVKKALG